MKLIIKVGVLRKCPPRIEYLDAICVHWVPDSKSSTSAPIARKRYGPLDTFIGAVGDDNAILLKENELVVDAAAADCSLK